MEPLVSVNRNVDAKLIALRGMDLMVGSRQITALMDLTEAATPEKIKSPPGIFLESEKTEPVKQY